MEDYPPYMYNQHGGDKNGVIWDKKDDRVIKKPKRKEGQRLFRRPS